MGISVTGRVDEIQTRMAKTKFGMKNAYTLVVDGKQYGAGFKHPGVNPGDIISFSHKGDTYSTIEGSISFGASAPAVPGSAVFPAPVTSGGVISKGKGSTPFPLPALHGDRIIVRQNALAHASRLTAARISMMESAIVMKLSNDDLANAVIALAKKFEAYSSGADDLRAVAEELKAEEVNEPQA